MDQAVRDASIGAWPEGLTRVPYWVYQDPEIARDEQTRVFEGPGWHYLCLEIDVPNQGITGPRWSAPCPSSLRGRRTAMSLHLKTGVPTEGR